MINAGLPSLVDGTDRDSFANESAFSDHQLTTPMTIQTASLVAGEKTAPRRVQLRRTKGWRMPENTVKVDRTTRFGNPHDWRDWIEQWPFDGPEAPGGHDRDGQYLPPEISRDEWCRAMATQAFEEDIRDGVIFLPVEELRGKNLACWCPHKSHKSCHVDVLLELANGEPL